MSYFTTGCRIGSRISFNNANLSGNVQRVGPTNDITSGIGIGYWYRQLPKYWVLGVQLGIVLTLELGQQK